MRARAHVAGAHRTYAAKTLLYAGVLGVAGSVIGVYAAAGLLLSVLDVSEAALRGTLPASLGFVAGVTRLTELGLPKLFLLLTLASATLGAALAVGMYYGRWELLDQRAHARGAEIDATLPRTVAFMYALSRSGMPFPRVMDTLAENEAVYGEAATELSVAVRDMNAFGTDALTARSSAPPGAPRATIWPTSRRTSRPCSAPANPSRRSSATSTSCIIRRRPSRNSNSIELLSTFAEAYVTALVAGPLFSSPFSS